MSFQHIERIQNIILIGFMGCGKSTIGRELKRLTGYQFIDMDAEIEAREKKASPLYSQMRVSSYFEKKKQNYSKNLEQKDWITA
jgi:shikimate kinase